MKKRETIGLVLILILIIGVSSYYLSLKSGYYVDEGMTLFLSNGQYNGAVTSKSEYNIGDFIEKYITKDGTSPSKMIKNVYNMVSELRTAGNYSQKGTVGWYDDAREMLQGQPQWISGEELYNQMVAEKGERFKYGQVYINQALDVHPVLYYAVVHTIFSIFAGKYSDVFLYLVNIIFLIMTCVCIYKLVREYWNNKYMAILSVMIFGFSKGFISCAVYFRMYAMLTFWVTYTLYLHLKMKKNHEEFLVKRNNAILIGISAFLGFNTHYYYILFLFPLFALTVWGLRKNKKILKKYIFIMAKAGFISIIFWPFSIYHILFGYRGTQAAESIFQSGLFEHFYVCLKEISDAMFYNNMFLAVIFLAAILIVNIINSVKKSKAGICMEMSVPMMFYLLIIIQIAPVISDRYVMCLFPIISIILANVFVNILENLIKTFKARKLVFLLIGIVLGVASVFAITPNYLYLDNKKCVLGIDKKEAYNCIMVGYDHGQGFSEALKLAEYDEIIVVGRDELQYLKTISDNINQKLMVYVYEGLDTEKILSEVSKNIGLICDWQEISSDVEFCKAFECK